MSGLSTVFPPPPAQYKYFTNENIEKLAAWKQRHASTDMNVLTDMMTDSFQEEAKEEAKSEAKDATEEKEKNEDGNDNNGSKNYSKKEMPEELEHPLDLLVPPTPPQNGTYRSFGSVWQTNDKLQSLKDMGITQLYTLREESKDKDATSGAEGENEVNGGGGIQDRIFELKKLLRSVLVQFVELTGIMSISPESFPDKTEDVRTTLINVHHLLNEYRPHQSRESLILLMEDELASKRRDIDELRATNEGIQNKIAALTQQFQELLPQTETGAGQHQGQPGLQDQQDAKTLGSSGQQQDPGESRQCALDRAQWQLLEA